MVLLVTLQKFVCRTFIILSFTDRIQMTLNYLEWLCNWVITKCMVDALFLCVNFLLVNVVYIRNNKSYISGFCYKTFIFKAFLHHLCSKIEDMPNLSS